MPSASLNSSQLLEHLRSQRVLLESGEWEQAVDDAGQVDVDASIAAIGNSADAADAGDRTLIAAEIELLLPLIEQLREQARDRIATLAPHQHHLQRIARDITENASGRLISEA